jgi:cyclic pyranopterin phosphate synthase
MASGVPRGTLTILSVNVSTAKGTAKTPVASIRVDEGGVVGDAHHGTPGRGVSLLDCASVEAMTREAGTEPIPAGAMGENLTCRFDGEPPSVGDLLRIGDLLLHVDRIGKECHGDGCAIFRSVGRCVMPSEGVFCTVMKGGTVTAGMTGSVRTP